MREAPAFSLLPPFNFFTIFNGIHSGSLCGEDRREVEHSQHVFVAGVLHTVRISNADSVQRGGELETITERVFE